MQEYAHEYAHIWYIVPSLFARSGGVYILRAGHNLAKPGYHVGPKRIECHSIHFVLQGELCLVHNGKETRLHSGDAFCLFPEQPYTYWRSSDAIPLRMIWLALDGHQAPLLISKAGFTQHRPYVEQVVKQGIQRVLHQLLNIIPRLPERDIDALRWLYHLFGKLEKSSFRSERKANRVKGEHWLQESIRYIELHFAEQLTIEGIAQKFGVHRSYFSERFSQFTGVSPKRYVLQLRMQKGANVLQATDRSVTEIALSLGYPDLYSFSRAFTAYYGISPSAYRERMQGTS